MAIFKFRIIKIVLLAIIDKVKKAWLCVEMDRQTYDLRKVVSWNVRLSEEDNNKGAPVI